jgi:hypothetical protein
MGIIEREVIEEALIDAGVEDADAIYVNYSGRGMYGETCFGVTVSDVREFFRFTAALGARDADTAYQLADALRSDSMGLDTIYYFPGWDVTSE